MALVRPLPQELNPPSTNEISTDNAEQLVLLEKSEKELLHQVPPPPSRREIYLISAKLALVLIFAISYLTFCFIVHYHNVPVGQSGVSGQPFLHVSTVSIITTMAILIVYVALWPMKGIIDEIRAEEFFRLMHIHPNGVPLDSVNAVSATTTGAFDIFLATIHRHCSPLLTSTLFISLVITATSSISPATLSAGSIWIDINDSTGVLIGAVPKGSIFNNSDYQFNFSNLTTMAATMAWVENFLNLTNSYHKVTSTEGDHLEYLVPFPPEYTSTMKAYWTTDVIVLDPSCSWPTVNVTSGNENVNGPWKVELTGSLADLGFVLSKEDLISTSINYSTTQLSFFPCTDMKLNTASVLVDGSGFFVIDQVESSPIWVTRRVDLSSIPTHKLPTGNVLALLLCSPRASIQTYQVRATGNGNLILEKHQPSQGNIDFIQANYLLSYALTRLPTDSGPTSDNFQVGTNLMERFIFGTNGADITGKDPAPLTNITAFYKNVIHSAMKTHLSGAISTTNVPGGFTEEQMVFTSSFGHIITSVILFAFITIAMVAAQFRKRRVAFTLVNVAAALAHSDVPEKCVEMTQSKVGMEERKVLKLVSSGDGRLNCAYQSIDQVER